MQPVSRDANVERAISRAAAAAAAVPGDSAVEEVARGIERFKRSHPGFVSPAGPDGSASVAQVLAEAKRTATPTAAAGTQCIPTWTTIEIGSTGWKAVPRRWVLDGLTVRALTGDGNSATEPWNTWVTNTSGTPSLNLLVADSTWLNGNTLYRVRPLPPSLCRPGGGILC